MHSTQIECTASPGTLPHTRLQICGFVVVMGCYGIQCNRELLRM